MCDCWHICHVRTRSASYQHRMTQYVLAGNVAAISGDFRGLARREHGPSDLKSVEKGGSRISESSGPLMTIAGIDP